MGSIYNLRTPAFLVDLKTLKNNCRVMREKCKNLGIQLRTHMKTHRTKEAGEYMTAGSKTCISVSTLSEAEFYANAGYDDITYAYPLSPDKIPQVCQLLSRLEKFHVLIDNLVVLKALVTNPPKEGKKWSVFLKVDCGYNRAGVSYKDPKSVELAKEICSKSCVDFQGLYIHEGNAYGCKGEDDIKETTAEAMKRLVMFYNKLKEAGINCPVVTIGSTPSCSRPPEDISRVTEFHPGNYVFYDYQQFLIGSCDMSDIAVRILTRVIGTYPDRGQILIDCGWTGLSLDSLGKLKTGYCLFEDHPNLNRVPPRSCILCTMSSMEIRSLTSGYRIKDGELKGRNAEVSILEGKIDFNNSACKESRSDALSVGMGISALAWWIYGRFATTETLPPANSRPQFNVQFNYKNEKRLVAN